jgi:hypothetical protein
VGTNASSRSSRQVPRCRLMRLAALERTARLSQVRRARCDALPLAWLSLPGPLPAHCAAPRRDGLTAPESVGRRCPQLRGSGVDLALGPRLVHGTLAFWMQTTGAALVAAERRSLARLLMPAQGGRSAHRLLYPTAVPDDLCQQERRQA